MAYSPDGRSFVADMADGKVHLRNTVTGQVVGKPLTHPTPVLAVAFSRSGTIILTGCMDGKARLWDVASGNLVYAADGGSQGAGLCSGD